MHHALQNYSPEIKREWDVRDEMLSFLAANENHFERKNLKRHFTGSGLLIDPVEHKVLLNYHKFLDMWLCFGGHADGESDLFNVALRETIEESGIETVQPATTQIFDIDIHAIPERIKKNEPPHEHYDVLYLFQASVNDPINVSEESVRVRWCDYEEAGKLAFRDGRMQRILDKWKRFKGF